jgi:NRPS condensation-like uncharacterized protein
VHVLLLSGCTLISCTSPSPCSAVACTKLLQRRAVHLQVWQVGKQQHILLASLHHAITDGWSVPILQRELSQAYAAVLNGTQPLWQPLPVQVCMQRL